MKDYIPHKDSELVAWSANFIAIVTAHASEWGVTPEELSRLQSITEKFALLYAQAYGPLKNRVVVAEKNTARTALMAEIRALEQFRLKNPVVTAAHRVALGLHVSDGTLSPVPPPSTRPELDIDVVDFRRLKIMFHDMGSNNKARPYGMVGAIVAYAVLDAPPTDIGALSRIALATRTPHVLEFTEAERGSRVYVALCWMNEKGEKGPWSEIENAIVP